MHQRIFLCCGNLRTTQKDSLQKFVVGGRLRGHDGVEALSAKCGTPANTPTFVKKIGQIPQRPVLVAILIGLICISGRFRCAANCQALLIGR
jgi:hypothetical protein